MAGKNRRGYLPQVAKARWLLALLGCACSDPDDAADEPPAAAWLDFTLSEPDGDRSCFAAAPSVYHVGSEDEPLTDGKDVVGCTIHEDEENAWFSGNLQGVEDGGFNVVFLLSTEDGVVVSMASDLTRTLLVDPSGTADCTPLFTLIFADAASAEFDCPLLTDPSDPTNGCGVHGTVNFENCEIE